MTRLISLLVFIFVTMPASALEIHPQIKADFVASGGPEKAIDHLACFLENYERERFFVKRATGLDNRCNKIEGGNRNLSVGNLQKAVIVDYTKPSTERRFFIIDLSQRSNQTIRSYFTSHGRFGNTSRSNTVPGPRSNTIKAIKHYSNVKGSNASSSGFFITGFEYQGRWSGPNKDKHSLVLHGIEKNINDNACDRAIVIHGNGFIRESGARQGVRKMSSGCYMLDYNHVNEVVAELRGGGGPFHRNENRSGGVVLLTYGPREAAMQSNYYCQPQARSGFHLLSGT